MTKNLLAEDETIWLRQQMMAELFQTTKQNIGQHLKNIFVEGELCQDSVVKKFFTTAADDKQYKTSFYNLDAIISVGYRVKNLIATHFRIWATQRLKEYIIKGFVMDDERLKNPPVAESQIPDYFDEILARIRDIRASERRMYLRVREIFALASDYEPTLKEQQAIASVLTTADAEIEAWEKKLARWRDQKIYLLNSMVMGSLRLPEFMRKKGVA